MISTWDSLMTFFYLVAQVCTGAKSEQQSKLAARKVLQEHNLYIFIELICLTTFFVVLPFVFTVLLLVKWLKCFCWPKSTTLLLYKLLFLKFSKTNFHGILSLSSCAKLLAPQYARIIQKLGFPAKFKVITYHFLYVYDNFH